MSKVQIGTKVDGFSIASTSGKTFTLSENIGKKVVIYFYPKDSTSGCTIEGKDFRDAKQQFDAANTVIVGVSKDDMESHELFKSNESFNFELLADSDGAICELFGVWKLKKKNDKEYMGIERSTFIINENGELTHEWRAVDVNAHVTKVLEAVQNSD